jgi:hypothetical protein
VFICHSLGGLVVKQVSTKLSQLTEFPLIKDGQALVEAKLDESYRSILDATCLLVFFATPHRGGNYASVGDVAAKICTMALRTPTNDLLNTLKRNSNEATKRFQQARHIFEKCLVVSFFEGSSYHKTGIVRLSKNPRGITLLTLLDCR